MDYRRSKITLAGRLDNYAASAKTSVRAQDWSAHLKRWPIYAAATGAALAVTTSADANTIVTGFSGVGIQAPNSQNTYANRGTTGTVGPVGTKSFGFYLHLTFQQHTSVSGSTTYGHTQGKVVINSSVVSRLGTMKFATSSGYLRQFNAGAPIGSGANFGTSGLVKFGKRATSSGNVTSSTSSGNFAHTGFAGFRLSNGDFGWIQLEWIGTPANSNMPYGIEALGWGIETDGSSINAGQTTTASATPEPGTLPLSLLALGAVGIVTWRKRRAQTA